MLISVIIIEKTRYPPGIYMFKVMNTNINTEARRNILSKLTIKIPVVISRYQLM